MTLGVMLAAHFMVFVFTSYGVRYQIKTSSDRLWINLWPSVVFLFFLFVKSMEEKTVSQRFVSGE
jgi:hypothetical protein